MAAIEEGQVTAAGEIGCDHHGWMLEYKLEPHAEGPLPGPSRRTIYLIGVRRWTYEGVERVGLLSAAFDSPFRGTEYHVTGDTEVKLVRHLKKGMPRMRKSDYPAEGA